MKPRLAPSGVEMPSEAGMQCVVQGGSTKGLTGGQSQRWGVARRLWDAGCDAQPMEESSDE